jgi:hypothetical protein
VTNKNVRMRRRPEYALFIALAAFTGAYALRDPAGFFAVLCEPWNVIRRSQHELNATLLDVTEGRGPIPAAGRRLLTPFGRIRFVRFLPTPSPTDDH